MKNKKKYNFDWVHIEYIFLIGIAFGMMYQTGESFIY